MNAICCNCGSEKRGAFEVCSNCKYLPFDEYSVSISMALTSVEMAPDDLAQAAEQIKQRRSFTIPLQSNSIVAKALGAAFITFDHSKVRSNVKAAEDMNKKAKNAALLNEYKRRSIILISSIFWLFASLTLISLSIYYTRDTVSLLSHGLVVNAEVTSYEPKQCGRKKRKHTCYYHNLSVENLGSVKLDLGSQFSPGTIVQVTVDSTSPNNIRLGDHTSIYKLGMIDFFAFFGIIFLPIIFIGSLLSVPDGLGLKSRSSRLATITISIVIIIFSASKVLTYFTGESMVGSVEKIISALLGAF